MTAFLENLCAAVTAPDPIATDAQRDLIGRAIADTLGCAAAGFAEPVTRNALAAYGSDSGPACWSGARCESAEAAVLVNGIAAHALDFDDVYLESMAHLSTVLVPAILTDPVTEPDAVFEAFAAGMIAARAVAARVGRGHYDKGWHGTGTMGAFGAAAAAGRMRGLGPDAMADAFALAAAMSGGLRVNFSTQAKPAHAGFAATAGVRAARLAAAGVAGSRAVFGERGYPGLYGTGDGVTEPDADMFALRPDRVSVKLFPCCFATHRMVGVALDAREAMGEAVIEDGLSYRLIVPQGGLEALVSEPPETGLQAKFSAEYCVAVALVRGAPTLADFTDAAVRDPAVRAVMERVTVVEDPAQPDGRDIEYGTMTLEIGDEAGSRRFERRVLPGSPADPPTPAALAAKLAGCLDIFAEAEGRLFPMLPVADRLGLGRWLRQGPDD